MVKIPIYAKTLRRCWKSPGKINFTIDRTASSPPISFHPSALATIGLLANSVEGQSQRHLIDSVWCNRRLRKIFLKKNQFFLLRKKTAQMALTFDSSFTRNDSGFKAALFHKGGRGLLGLVA
jgi:hypothetical protein